MLPTDRAGRYARCLNTSGCPKAAAQESIEWYAGPGEYCPECGEGLSVRDDLEPSAPPDGTTPRSANGNGASGANVLDPAPARPAAIPRAAQAQSAVHANRTGQTKTVAPPSAPASRSATAAANGGHSAPQAKARLQGKPPDQAPAAVAPATPAAAPSPLRWLWLAGALGVVVALGAVFVARQAGPSHRADRSITICPMAAEPQIAAELVRGYVAKASLPADGFRVRRAADCDVRFSALPESTDAVIARDGIVAIVNPRNPLPRVSEAQLRAIFSGTLRDWLQLGGAEGTIVPVLPAVGTEEAKAIGSSLFYGVEFDRSVLRRPSSSDVARAVVANRDAVGLIAYSQIGAARVVPLAYLPAPTAASIGSRRYPYTLPIAVIPGNKRANASADAFIEFARSPDGAAIIVRNRLAPGNAPQPTSSRSAR